jgi:hypothetical protein
MRGQASNLALEWVNRGASIGDPLFMIKWIPAQERCGNDVIELSFSIETVVIYAVRRRPGGSRCCLMIPH